MLETTTQHPSGRRPGDRRRSISPALAVGAFALVALGGAGACNDPDVIREILEELERKGSGKACGGPRGAACTPREYCERPAGTCDANAPGVCRARPEACPAIYAPVCGCDGKTYGNDCERAAAGVTKARDGECASQVVVADGQGCGGFTPPPLRVCKPGSFCMQLPGTCNAADVPGICETTPQACTREYAPVCGCDGKTYGNDCTRRAARVPLDHAGECQPGVPEGRACDGFAGIACQAGLFCEHPPGTCQVADQDGVCKRIPQACTANLDPVCGCDGKTYGNDCVRQVAGVPKAHDGACRSAS